MPTDPYIRYDPDSAHLRRPSGDLRLRVDLRRTGPDEVDLLARYRAAAEARARPRGVRGWFAAISRWWKGRRRR